MRGLDSSRPPSFIPLPVLARRPFATVDAASPSPLAAGAAVGAGRTLAHVDTCPCERLALRPCRRPRFERPTGRRQAEVHS